MSKGAATMMISSVQNKQKSFSAFYFSEDYKHIAVITSSNVCIYTFPLLEFVNKITIHYPSYVCFLSALEFIVLSTTGYLYKCNISGEKKALGKIPLKKWDEFSPIYKLTTNEVMTCSSDAVWAINMNTLAPRRISPMEKRTPVVVYNPAVDEYCYYDRIIDDSYPEQIEVHNLFREGSTELKIHGVMETDTIEYSSDGTIYAYFDEWTDFSKWKNWLKGRKPSHIVHFNQDGSIIYQSQVRYYGYCSRIVILGEYLLLYVPSVDTELHVLDRHTFQEKYRITKPEPYPFEYVGFVNNMLILCSGEYLVVFDKIENIQFPG